MNNYEYSILFGINYQLFIYLFNYINKLIIFNMWNIGCRLVCYNFESVQNILTNLLGINSEEY